MATSSPTRQRPARPAGRAKRPAARKPAQRKPAARKPAQRKPAARKPAARRPAPRRTGPNPLVVFVNWLLQLLVSLWVGLAGLVGAIARGIGESASELEPEQ